MHTDEAVHAVKFGLLLEENYYRYDSNEYHGPTLNYFTLIPAWLQSIHTFQDVQEQTLRIVAVFFGTLLIILTIGLKKGLGWPASLFILLFTALSPAMVFYSRYYIQEILLVCFLFGFLVSGYRYFCYPSIFWSIATGIFAGLSYATKETFIIFVTVIWFSLLLAMLFSFPIKKNLQIAKKKIKFFHVILAFGSFLVIFSLFFSSFFSYPSGIKESVGFLKSYFNRASQNEYHLYPWYYYFKMILYYRQGSGPIWSEAFILILGGIGIYSGFVKSSQKYIDPFLHKFLVFYTLLLALIFSLIPYKTPWNMLGFLHGFILLAGIGSAYLFQRFQSKYQLISLCVIFSIGTINLAFQSWRAIEPYSSSPLNPYVYSHPTEKIYDLVKRVNEVVLAQPEGKNLYMEVIYPGSNYWPLPWYFRKFPNVGYWPEVNMNFPAAPMILVSPELEAELIKKLYEVPPPGERYLYVPLFDSYMELRPQAEIRGYVTTKVWSNYYSQQP